MLFTVGAGAVAELPCSHHDIVALYRCIREKPYMTANHVVLDSRSEGVETPPTTDRLEHTKQLLLAKLRPYQADAVQWMIGKERG